MKQELQSPAKIGRESSEFTGFRRPTSFALDQRKSSLLPTFCDVRLYAPGSLQQVLLRRDRFATLCSQIRSTQQRLLALRNREL